MIYEITNILNFKKVAKIINNSENINNAFAHSVVAGNTLGWVFVDDIKNPTSAIIWPKALG
jgi:hypothetical protein